MGYYYGNWAGPGAKFRVVVAYSFSNYRDDVVHVQARYYVEVSDGSAFNGTVIKTSWGQTVRLYGQGVYADTGWCDWGDPGYGYTARSSISADYTSYSGAYHKSSVDGVETVSAPEWQPYNISGLKVERQSDSSAKLIWSNNAHAARPYRHIYIDQRIDGGAWSNVADLTNSPTSWTASTAPDHSYEWRVIPNNYSGSAPDYQYAGPVYNTPAPPRFVSVARKSNTIVTATLDNSSNTATSLEYQTCKQGSTGWGEWGESTYVDGLVKTFDVDLGGGTFKLRARNKRLHLDSEWSESGAVVTICPPMAPTLVTPASSGVIASNEPYVAYQWRHNPYDGSEQQKAELAISIDGGSSWTVDTVTGNQSTIVKTNAYGVNQQVVWRVRTKGADENFGPWSANRIFTVRQRPTVVIEQPADGFVITDVPISVKLTYIDQSGTVQASTLTIARDGETVFTKSLGKSLTTTITADEWVPVDGETYVIDVTSRSTSSLTATAKRTVTTKFRLPQRGNIFVETDPATGCATVQVRLSRDSELAAAVRLDLYRVAETGRIKIGSDMSDGAEVIDRFAPLNIEYTYEAVTTSGTGAVNTSTATGIIETPWWFIVYDGGIAQAMWEPSGSRAPTRPSDEIVELDGRTWPLLVQSRQRSLKIDFSGWVESREQARAFESMTFASGDKIYKGLSGDVFHCSASAKIDEEYDGFEDYSASVSVSITRVDGGEV